MSQPTRPSEDRQWFVLSRWQAYEGEGRANLLRIVAIGVFYAIQLFVWFTTQAPSETQLQFHRAATALAVAGAISALVVLLCLQRRVFPPALPYLSTASDLILVTALASYGSGPLSPLTRVYFVVIALAALRFRLTLIWFASGGAVACYLALVGLADSTWFNADHVVPVAEQLMTIATLALTGVVGGQFVRRVRVLATEYHSRVAAAAASHAEEAT